MRNWAVIATLVISGSAHALTGNALHDMMQRDGTPGDKLPPLAYVVGVTDGLTWGQFVVREYGGMKTAHFGYCIPEGVQVEQQYDVVKAFLVDNPGDRHSPAGMLVGIALSRAWPCK